MRDRKIRAAEIIFSLVFGIFVASFIWVWFSPAMSGPALLVLFVSTIFLYALSRFILLWTIRKAVVADAEQDVDGSIEAYRLAVNYGAGEDVSSRLVMLLMVKKRFSEAMRLILRWPNYSKFLFFYNNVIDRLSQERRKIAEGAEHDSELIAAAVDVLPFSGEKPVRFASQSPVYRGEVMWGDERLWFVLGALTVLWSVVLDGLPIGSEFVFLGLIVVSFLAVESHNARWKKGAIIVANAESAIAEGRYAEAIEFYEQYVRKVSLDKDVFLRMASISMENMNWDRAERYLQGDAPGVRGWRAAEFRRKMANYPPALYCLAQNYRLAKRIDDSKAILSRLEVYEQWRSMVEYERSFCEEVAGDMAAAKESIKRAAELAAVNPLIANRLVEMLRDEGKEMLKRLLAAEEGVNANQNGE